MSKHLNKTVGVLGEKQAVKHLKKQGYKILHTNYTVPIGEVDIIAKDNETLVFIEVKTRKTNEFGLGREAVTPYKQNKVRQVATQYLKLQGKLSAEARCDVIEVQNGTVTHIKNAF